MDDRIYRKDEIKNVLERAVELQASSAEDTDETGLTLAELQEVARASGIDPALVQLAASELEARDRKTTSRSATHIFAERIVEGSLTDETWEDALVELRSRFEVSEDARTEEKQFGANLSWMHVDSDEVVTQVHVTPRESGLHLRLSQHIASGDPAFESLFWAGISTIILGTLLTSQVDGTFLTVAVYATVFLLSFVASYGLDKKWRGSRQRELNELADVLAARLQPAQHVRRHASSSESLADQESVEDRSGRIAVEDSSGSEPSQPASAPGSTRRRSQA